MTYRTKLRDRVAYRIALVGFMIASPEYRALCEVVTKRGGQSLRETIEDLAKKAKEEEWR